MHSRRLILVATLTMLPALVSPAQDAAKKKGKDFTGQSLPMRDFSGQELENAIFNEANLLLAQFKNSKLSGATFRKADITSASFTSATLIGADLREATLDYTSFESANLSKANLEGLYLQTSSLQGADLRGANLRKVRGLGDITRADFRDADLRGAVMTPGKDYNNKSAKFTGAKYDKNTRWPNGFDVEASGAVLSDSPDEQVAAGDPKDKKDDPSGGKDGDPGKPLATNKPAGAPSEEFVRQTLENSFWGPPAFRTKQRYRYQKMVYDAPSTVIDQTTEEKRKIVLFGVTVVADITIDFPDGTSRTEAKNQTFAFFKDEKDQWQFRFIQNNK